MKQEKESGKRSMVKGLFRFFWEELKTLNSAKLKSLSLIATGYLRMKYTKTPKTSSESSSPETERNKDGSIPLTY